MRFRSIAFSLVGAIAALFSQESQAAGSGLRDFRIHQHYQSYRALGMGNAFTAVADDYATLFYNPAGLARLEEGQINLSLFGASADTKLSKLYSDIEGVQGSSDEVQKIVDILNANLGNAYSLRVGALQGIWARPGWGLGILPVELNLDLSIHQLGTYALNVNAYQDSTIAYGRGYDVKWLGEGHRLSVGWTAKAVYRAYFSKAFLASDLALDSKLLRPEDANEGMTLDADLGALWTPKLSQNSWWRMARPTVGVTVRNIADYGFKMNGHLLDKNSGEPPKLGRRLDIGSMFELPDWWIFKTRLAADMRDIGHDNFSVKKGSHLGAEFLWKVRSWWQGGWRIGLNQGYLTAGFTGKIGVFNLDLVTYSDDVGPSDAPKAVRYYGAKASLDW